MSLSNEAVAEIAHTAMRRHSIVYHGRVHRTLPPEWSEMPEGGKREIIAAVEFIRKSNPMDGPEAVFNFIMGPHGRAGMFDMAPTDIQEQIFILRAIVTALTGWVEPISIDPPMMPPRDRDNFLRW